MTGSGGPPTHDHRSLRRLRFPLGMWSAITAVLLVAQHYSARISRDPHYRFRPSYGLHFFLDGWNQFDGPEYLKIVEHGYSYVPGQRSNIVWFPLYPICVRAVHGVIADPMVAAIVVSAVGGAAAACVYWLWLARHMDVRANQIGAFLALLVYPYAWYLFGVVHSDSLFLALVIAAFLCIEKDRLLWAGVLGALATATRPTGFAVIAGLVAVALDRGGVFTVATMHAGSPAGLWRSRARSFVNRFAVPTQFHRNRLTPRLGLPLLSCIGLGAYMTYLGVRWGDPLAFVHNERVYHPGNLPWLKRAVFVWWRDSPNLSYPLTITAQGIIVALVLVSVPFVGRRFGWGYALYVFILAMIPTLSTEDFMGSGRYLIAAFPCHALFGEWLVRRFRWSWAWLAFSGTAMGLLSMAFARSWYLT